MVAARNHWRQSSRDAAFRREKSRASRHQDRQWRCPRPRSGLHPCRLPSQLARGAAASHPLRRRRHAYPRSAISAARRHVRRKASGHDLLPRRIPPPDAARLALHGLLSQRLWHEPVPGKPRLRRALGKLSQRHRLRSELPRSRQLRRIRRKRVQRCARRRSVSSYPYRCRPQTHRPLGRLLRRLSHRARLGARLRSFRRGRRLPRCPRLERFSRL